MAASVWNTRQDLKMSRLPCIDKRLLRNVIRHTDAHNKMQEVSVMWKQRQMQTFTEDGGVRRKRRRMASPVLGRSHMRCDGYDDDDDDAVAAAATAEASDDGRRWRRRLHEAEAPNPDRWGHAGFWELYPSDYRPPLDKRIKARNGPLRHFSSSSSSSSSSSASNEAAARRCGSGERRTRQKKKKKRRKEKSGEKRGDERRRKRRRSAEEREGDGGEHVGRAERRRERRDRRSGERRDGRSDDGEGGKKKKKKRRRRRFEGARPGGHDP